MIYIISKETFGDYGIRDIQSNSCWTECALDGYAVIPDEMVEDIIATKGFCDIVLNDEGTEVVSFTARELPDLPECFKDGFLKLSGGTMTGDVNMGNRVILNIKNINGARVNTFQSGGEDTQFVFARGGTVTYLVFGQTGSGPCLYLLSASIGSNNLSVNKLFGAEYAIIINPHVTNDSLYFTFPKNGCGALIAANSAEVV